MHIVMLKYENVQTCVYEHKHDAFSHSITQVGDYLHTYSERTEDR